MTENTILKEIRKTRDEHAKEHAYSVHKIFEQLRLDTEKLKSEGWQVINKQKLPLNHK
jgi:hypothetical protein